MKVISTNKELTERYAPAKEMSLWKELDHINEHYKRFIEKSPFLILSTCGETSIDCSPRGDPPGFVRIENDKCILIPDRKGNNRLDSLRNIIRNPNVGIIFLIPNVGESLRLSGKAKILVDDDLCQSFSINGKPAISVLSIQVEKVYYQCQKAIYRSGLWDASAYIDRSELPTAGQMNKIFSNHRDADFDAKAYDDNYPEYMKENAY